MSKLRVLYWKLDLELTKFLGSLLGWITQVAMTHRSGGPQAKTVGYLKPKEKKPTRPEESLALQGSVHLSCWQLDIEDGLIKIYHIDVINCRCSEIEDDFAEIEEIWNEPEPDFVCVIIPEVFLLDNHWIYQHYNHHHLHQ